MSGEIRIKRQGKCVVGTLTIALIASQLMGCSAMSKSELNKMIDNSQQVEIEVAEPASEEQGKTRPVNENHGIGWERLGFITETAKERTAFRDGVDELMGTVLDTESMNRKNGIAYVDPETGESDSDNTLYNAMLNKQFSEFLNEHMEELAGLADAYYADTSETADMGDGLYGAINFYWNLLPDGADSPTTNPDDGIQYFNGSETLSRAEAMAFVARATVRTQDGKDAISKDSEKKHVPKAGLDENDLRNWEAGKFTVWRSNVNEMGTDLEGRYSYEDLSYLVRDNAYLREDDKSLEYQTISGTMTRAEYVYLLVDRVFGSDRIASADIKNPQVKVPSDIKNGGDIAKKQGFSGKDRAMAYELAYAVQNPDEGTPEQLYKGMVAALELGILDGNEASRWDEGITKTEATDLFIKAMQRYTDLNGFKVDSTGLEHLSADQLSHIQSVNNEREEREYNREVIDEAIKNGEPLTKDGHLVENVESYADPTDEGEDNASSEAGSSNGNSASGNAGLSDEGQSKQDEKPSAPAPKQEQPEQKQEAPKQEQPSESHAPGEAWEEPDGTMHFSDGTVLHPGESHTGENGVTVTYGGHTVSGAW